MKKLLCLLLSFVFLASCNEAEKSESSVSDSLSTESKAEQSEENESKDSESSEDTISDLSSAESKAEQSEDNESQDFESSEFSWEILSDKPLVLSECEIYTAWANSYTEVFDSESALYKNALNSEKISSPDPFEGRKLPIYKFESVEDVNSFKNAFKESLSFDSSYNEVSSFDKVMENVDEEFFKTKTVFVSYVFSGTGSYRFLVTDIDENGTFVISQKEYPCEEVTDDEAGWYMIVFAPKEKADKLTNIDAIYSTEVYKEK